MHIKTDHFESSLGQTQTPYILFGHFFHSVITSVFQETEAKCVAALVKGEKKTRSPDKPQRLSRPTRLQSIGSRGRSSAFLGVHADVTLLPSWTGHDPTFSEIQ